MTANTFVDFKTPATTDLGEVIETGTLAILLRLITFLCHLFVRYRMCM